MDRVRKSEMESILNVLDAESDRILEGYGLGVLYGGLQEQTPSEMGDEQIEVSCGFVITVIIAHFHIWTL